MEASDGESARQRAFRVSIKWAATVDIQALVEFVRYSGSPAAACHKHACPQGEAPTCLLSGWV